MPNHLGRLVETVVGMGSGHRESRGQAALEPAWSPELWLKWVWSVGSLRDKPHGGGSCTWLKQVREVGISGDKLPQSWRYGWRRHRPWGLLLASCRPGMSLGSRASLSSFLVGSCGKVGGVCNKWRSLVPPVPWRIAQLSCLELKNGFLYVYSR